MNDIIHDIKQKKFILKLENDEQAEVVYTFEGDTMRLVYSEVPYHLRGQGIGKILVEKTFESLTASGYQAEAVCGYIRAVARRSEKWRDIIKH